MSKNVFYKKDYLEALQVERDFTNIKEIKTFIYYKNNYPLWTPDSSQVVVEGGSGVSKGGLYASPLDWILKKSEFNITVVSNDEFLNDYVIRNNDV